MSVTTKSSRGISTALRAVAGALTVFVAMSGTAQAQGTNDGALSVTAVFDVPSLYLFRGIRQEVDPGVTMWPYADLGINFLSDGAGGLKSFDVNFGVWNSLHTGSSGTGDFGPGKLNYEEDFYAGFTLGFGGATSFATTYTAYTSPNGVFTTVKEISFKVAQDSMYAPYGLLAFEVGGSGAGQADGGGGKGTYLELGIGPSWGEMVTVTVPVKVGLSLNNYYENPFTGDDSKFGFFDIGAVVSVPLTRIPERFGSWDFHFGGDYFALGDTTEIFNVNKDGDTSKHKVVGLFGFGVSY